MFHIDITPKNRYPLTSQQKEDTMNQNRRPHFVDYFVSKTIKPDDTMKTICESIDFFFIRVLVKGNYKNHRLGRQGYNPVSIFKALLLIYLGYASSERDLARKLKDIPKLSYLCGFRFGNIHEHNTSLYFRKRLGKETFLDIIANTIAGGGCIIEDKKLRGYTFRVNTGKCNNTGPLPVKNFIGIKIKDISAFIFGRIAITSQNVICGNIEFFQNISLQIFHISHLSVKPPITF